jgi:type I restriction enzyme S subunit
MQAKPYPRTKPSGGEWLGDVPEHWDVKRLKYFATINDEALPETTSADFELEYVDIGGVNAVEGITATEQFVFENAPSRARRKVRHGDTIVSTVRTYLRAITSIKNPPENLIVSTGFAVVRPRDVDSAFLAYATRESSFVESVVARSVGVSYPAVNASEIGGIPIPLPSSNEQRAIAAFLDWETGRLDTLVAKNRELLERLKEQRTALISRTVTRGLNLEAKLKPSGIEWLGEIPEHWKATKVGYYISILSGFAFPSTGFTHDDTDTRLLRGINVGVSEIRWDETVYWNRSEGDGLDAFNLKAGTLVIGMDRPWISDGVRVAIITEKDLPCLLLQRVAAIKPSRHLCRDYLFRILSSPIFVDYFTPDMTGVSVPHISPDQINNFPIPIPPLPEQRAIAAYLDAETAKLDALAAKVGEAIERLQEYRIALITAAVTGKIDVRDHLGPDTR